MWHHLQNFVLRKSPGVLAREGEGWRRAVVDLLKTRGVELPHHHDPRRVLDGGDGFDSCPRPALRPQRKSHDDLEICPICLEAHHRQLAEYGVKRTGLCYQHAFQEIESPGLYLFLDFIYPALQLCQYLTVFGGATEGIPESLPGNLCGLQTRGNHQLRPGNPLGCGSIRLLSRRSWQGLSLLGGHLP
jgi:hypothetical protein